MSASPSVSSRTALTAIPIAARDVLLEPAPYRALIRQVDALPSLTQEEKTAILTTASLAALEALDFDEAWYISAYPDVQAAVARGDIMSGLQHFRALGFFEGRFPKEIDFDEESYCATYPDIRRAVNSGLLAAPKIHFISKGYAEGRVPSASYSFSRSSSVELLWQIRHRVGRS